VAPGDQTLLMQFRSRTDAAEMLAGSLADTMRAAAAAQGSASLVVSGGESPLGLFGLLRTIRLPWESVTVLPSDERWVDPHDASSNEGMIRRELLQGPVAAARFVSLYRPGLEPDEAVAELNDAMSAIRWPLDAVVLGMGADGHTASLFPNSPDIESALRSDDPIIVQRPPHLPHARLSLTSAALTNANEIKLLFFGGEKLDVFLRAMEPGDVAELPIRAIIHQTDVPVTVYWAP
jgi:6-phosphogluconolactonase